MSKRLSVCPLCFFSIVFLLLCFIVGQFAVIQTVDAATHPITKGDTHPSAAPINSLKLIIILAEFPDARHTLSADEVKKRVLNEIIDYYQECSYGTFSLTGDIIPDWITMPKPFSSYGNMMSFTSGWENRRALVSDVIKAADDIVDFRKYDLPIIVLPNVRSLGYSVRAAVATNDGITVSSVTLQTQTVPASVFVHEIGHSIWLPDLYDHAQADKVGSSDAAAIYVGRWCLMSTAARGSVHFCAYNKILLDWISSERVKVVSPGSSELITLEPIEIKTQGIQAVKIPLTTQSYYLIEARRKIGFDKVLPDEGVLITLVDQSIKGDGFIKVIDAKPATSSFDDATFDVRSGKENIFTDANRNIAVVVVWSVDSSYGVYVMTPNMTAEISKGFNEISKTSGIISQAKSRIDQATTARFKSSQAQSLLKEAQDKYDSALASFKAQKYELAAREAGGVMDLLDRAFTTEQSYSKEAEAASEALPQSQSALQKAEKAIQAAESDGRTSGLDEAKDLLQQAMTAQEARNYDKALVLAIKAQKAAEAAMVAAKGTGGSYYWYIGAVIAVVVIAVVAFVLVRKKKRG